MQIDLLRQTVGSFLYEEKVHQVRLLHTSAGADPGFPQEGPPTLKRGRQHIIFTKVSEKLHEIEKILVRKGERRERPPPPLGSATDRFHNLLRPIFHDRLCLEKYVK